MIQMAMAFVHDEGISGDYLEFGVFRGATFVQAWHAARHYNASGIRFHAFDSFQGLPTLSRTDGPAPFHVGQFASPRTAFERTLRRHGVPQSRVTITEGYFHETLNAELRTVLRLDRAAVAFIDCDLYSSCVPVLDWLTTLLADGSVLIFDDWYTHKAKSHAGEQQACAEWLGAHPELSLIPYRTFHWAGQSFIVNRSTDLLNIDDGLRIQ